jgi:protein TonB
MRSSLIRILFVAPQAFLVTLSLLVLMVSLIEFADKELDKTERIRLPDIMMPDFEMTVQRIVQKPDKPVIDETPPPEVPEQDFEQIDGDAAVGKVVSPKRIKANMDLTIGAGLQASDGEYLPIVKVAPIYPRRALERGTEGYVVLEYTVTKQGTVRNPIVIEAKPPNVFERAAIKSALRYKYKPRVEDGEPVEVPGVRTRVIFKMAK